MHPKQSRNSMDFTAKSTKNIKKFVNLYTGTIKQFVISRH